LTEEQITAAQSAAKINGWTLSGDTIRRIAPHVQARGETEPPTMVEVDWFCEHEPFESEQSSVRIRLESFCKGRADEINALKDRVSYIETHNGFLAANLAACKDRLQATQGFTVEQVREAIDAEIKDGGFGWGFTSLVISRLTATPKTPEERFKVESVHNGSRWIVVDMLSGENITDIFIVKETAELVREALIARAKKEAK